ATGGDAVVTSDVGQHQMWAAQYFHFAAPRRWINSGGLGTMGFGLPAAMGAKVGRPDQTVVCIAGDGSVQMNMQELATCAQGGIAIKVFIMNNGYLGMVRQWQEVFWDKRYSHVDMGQYPDYVKLAGAYRAAGLFARRGFNIDTLAVGPTDDERFSRITLTLDGAKHSIDQVTKQLHKLVNVLKIRDLEPEETLSRELALFKVSADGANRSEVM